MFVFAALLTVLVAYMFGNLAKKTSGLSPAERQTISGWSVITSPIVGMVLALIVGIGGGTAFLVTGVAVLSGALVFTFAIAFE